MEVASTDALGLICQSTAFNKEVQIQIDGRSQPMGLKLGPVCRVEWDKLEFDGTCGPDVPSIGVEIPEVAIGSFADKFGLR